MDREEIKRKNQPKFAALKALNLPSGQYAITGSGALGIRGLRLIGDIDIIVTSPLWDSLTDKYDITKDKNFDKIIFPDGIIEAFTNSSFYNDINAPSINKRITHAEIIDGLPFELLEDVLYFKRKMGREKDLQDIMMIETFQKQEKLLKR